MTHSIIIVGAGIFGVTGALELQKRGYSVTLFDPGPVPHPKAASTDISKVIRMDYGADEFYTKLMETAFIGWDAWNEQWEEPLYHEEGFLLMIPGEMQSGDHEHDSFIALLKRGHTLERMTPATLKARYPVWAAEIYQDGYFNPRGGWAESGRVVAKLLDLCRAEGVEICEGQQMERLIVTKEEDKKQVTGIMTTDKKTYKADYVIVAAGSWTPHLLPHLSEMMWTVGQPVFHFRPPDAILPNYQQPNFVTWAADITHTGWYGFSALEDGTLKVANHGPGRRVNPEEGNEVDREEEIRCRTFFCDAFPDIADAPLIKTRLCYYCDTWDGDFWIDHDPNLPGLMVASGGSGHAFKFAPILGEIIADVLERKPNEFASRFEWRRRKNEAIRQRK